MSESKNKRVIARPPKGFEYVEDQDDFETLAEVYAKLNSLASIFSRYYCEKNVTIEASEIYGLWYVLRDICEDLEGVLKLDCWNARKNAIAERQAAK